MRNDTLNNTKKYSHLSLAEREEIAINLEKGYSQKEIAFFLNRHPSTISREMSRNNPSVRAVRYRANRAQLKADTRKYESHKKRRIPHKSLRRYICKQLGKGYSPEIIAVMAVQKNVF
jgi:IS30 family transposase